MSARNRTEATAFGAHRHPNLHLHLCSKAIRSEPPHYVQGGLFRAFLVRDGRLITGQQQYSGRKVAQVLIEVLGI